MVIANNSIRLREIQQCIIEDDTTFQNIHNVSISVLCCVLARNRIRMKRIYRVPFERNSERVKQLRYDYVQVNYSIIGTESGSAYCSTVHGPAVLHLFCLVQRVMELEAEGRF